MLRHALVVEVKVQQLALHIIRAVVGHNCRDFETLAALENLIAERRAGERQIIGQWFGVTHNITAHTGYFSQRRQICRAAVGEHIKLAIDVARLLQHLTRERKCACEIGFRPGLRQRLHGVAQLIRFDKWAAGQQRCRLRGGDEVDFIARRKNVCNRLHLTARQSQR